MEPMIAVVCEQDYQVDYKWYEQEGRVFFHLSKKFETWMPRRNFFLTSKLAPPSCMDFDLDQEQEYHPLYPLYKQIIAIPLSSSMSM